MSRNDRQSKHTAWCRRWTVSFAFLLLMFAGHLALVTTYTSASALGAESLLSSTSDHVPAHGLECSIDDPLVSPDRVRLGSVAIDGANTDLAHLSSAAIPDSHPAVQAPPLASDTRRALLQIFLI